MTLGRCCLLSIIRYTSELTKQRCGQNRGTKSHLLQGASLSIGVHQLGRTREKSLTFLTFSANMASTSNSKNKQQETNNRLALEKSPYLRQHATNPVDWYPWCDEALKKAMNEDKLIFLSVGYSTCHWCHVMEKESFKNKEIAKIMNENFINIKVDREERPDIDRIYMTFIQALTGHGGWPMSVFLTPDLKPVIGGTYFPPEDTRTQTGFKTILLNIAQKWKELKTKMIESGSHNLETLQNISDISHTSKTDDVPSLECCKICIQQLTNEFEPEFGGFGSEYMQSPKFPQPVNLNFLFYMYIRQPTEEIAKQCLHMCVYTLTKMSYGGIHDHVGQGFSRYSTDSEWHVPHFEKMLYDQGQLMQSYADAYLATKDVLFAEVIDDIATYVVRDLRHQEGGFYSAEDADSYPTPDANAKKEGAFYVWTATEVKSLLDKEISGGKNIKLSDIFCHHFNIKESGNVKKYQDPHGELTGKNVLIMYNGIEDTAKKFNLTNEETKSHLKEACSILYKARSARPRPHLDDKIIAAWNGLMISGLARGGAAVGNTQYIEYAADAAKFIERYLFDETKGVLLRSCYRDDKDAITQTSVPIAGFLDDYAFVVKGLLDLYEASLRVRWLELAEKLQNIQDKLFWDEANGGYFSTTSEDPAIILRLKEAHDGAEPSGNSIAAENLLRLADYLDRSELKDRAARLFGSFRRLLMVRPIALPQLVLALVRYYDDATQIYIAGKRDAKDTNDLLRVVYERLIPGRTLLFADPDDTSSMLFRRNEHLCKMKPLDGRATAYVCRNHTCSLPVTDPVRLAVLLDDQRYVTK
ncbi:spermatogenesis-associated protein 20 isoform X1 [Hylaeus anthracinus]|uniref:spermatogenesis-associated protein 20 isoform X1 n=2 Tax=Hylaeus anthracinus TaxID=313031 RepID=UPI0023B977E9|nr:spermatogenesis-associated protein 20 isoform X1 [Hylaeus anthracinus]XP_053995703.1 spermatogenesis-associated protein 20 isoform X1 [Hylaeus anthracinus]XP_053995704.1 spermatogenesis-associated protein 20 isoform X1 [Hylaeus anthracinus]XP_053995706.1 spermatogenesis-associated protein 20 isoform X1 [Hylaeus anthracinus]XP_053995707.1 spermatogenesis-associated protein 20 isoform X1 [Hylaeus anthracinus]XP_053995708.1 spermatogenesis-associated protein 20 isoform X1 [Hylaeus anthracinus]